jgi:hypothetical protein
MRTLVLLFSGILLVGPAYSQEENARPFYELNAGFGLLIYQSVYSLENSFGIEAAVRSRIAGPFDWQAGVRLGLGPVLPEVFGRAILVQDCGAWTPGIGVELGVTARAKFPGGTGLLEETRSAMNRDPGLVYLSVHAAPLAFRLREQWKLSFMELDFGTHFAGFGRTLRGQLTLVSVSRKF